MPAEVAQRVHFGPFVFEIRSGRLEKHGYRIKIQPKSAAVLSCLIETAGEVVLREELQAKLWPQGTYVDFELGIKVAIKKLRDALGDLAAEPKYIETVRGKGYRFLAAVNRVEASAPVEAAAPVVAGGEEATRWWSRGRWWMAIGALACAAAIAVAMLPRGSRPALKFHSRDWVLIADFDNRTGEKLLDGTLEYALERELSNSKFVNVVPRERVQDVLRLMKKPADARLDRNTAREVCLRDGEIKALVTGRVEKLGTTYVLSVQIIDPARDVTVTSLSEEDPADTLLARTVRRLSNRVRETLGEDEQRVRSGEQQLEKVTTPSLHALQLYTQANREIARSDGGDRAAAELLQQALKDDPNFASAHVLLAWAYANLEKHDLATLHFRRAFELADTTTDRERYFIVGSYYGGAGVDQPQKSIEAYEALLRLYPDHSWAPNNLVLEYVRARQEEKVTPLHVHLADLRPNDERTNLNAAIDLIFEAYARARERSNGPISPAAFDGARKYLNRAIALSAAEPMAAIEASPRVYAAYMAFLEGDVDLARRNIDEAARVEPFPHPVTLGYAYADLGKLHEAEQQIAAEPDNSKFGLAEIAYVRGDLGSVRKYLQEMRQPVPYYALDVAGVMMVHAGLISDANALRSRWKKLQKRPANGLPAPPEGLRIIEGELALALGDMSRGCTLLEEAVRQQQEIGASSTYMAQEDLAHAYRKMRRTADAIRVLETGSHGPIAMNFSPAYRMRVQLQLAQLYRETGRVSDAQRVEVELSRQLAFADPDHPIVRQLAALRQSPVVAAAN